MGFDETKVKRGQPGNAGQFALGPVGQVSDDQMTRLRAAAGATDLEAVEGGGGPHAAGRELRLPPRRDPAGPGVVRPNIGDRPMVELEDLDDAGLRAATGASPDAIWSIEMGPLHGPKVHVIQDDGRTAVAAAAYLAAANDEQRVWVSVTEEDGTRWVAGGSAKDGLRWSPAGIDGPPAAIPAGELRQGDCTYSRDSGLGYPITTITPQGVDRIRLDFEAGGFSEHPAEEYVAVLVDRIDRRLEPLARVPEEPWPEEDPAYGPTRADVISLAWGPKHRRTPLPS